MTTPDDSPLDAAAEADVADQRLPVDDGGADAWRDAKQVSEDRDWQASEADLIEQAIAVPEDEPEPDL